MTGKNKFGFDPLDQVPGATRRERSVGPMGAAVREAAASLQESTEAKIEQRRRNAEDAKAWRDAQAEGRVLVRLGLDEVQGLGLEAAHRIVAARCERPFVDMADVSRRAELSVAQMEALATAGAFDAFGLSRRQALWNAGYIERSDQLEGTQVQAPPPMLPGMSDVEITTADLWATHISPDTHPIEHLRPRLDAAGIRSIESLHRIEHGTRVRVGGLITHRQRPGTASGITFLNLEDETGMLNIVCSQSMWARYRVIARTSAGMVIRGILERSDGTINLVADKLERIEVVYPHRSRDFQ